MTLDQSAGRWFRITVLVSVLLGFSSPVWGHDPSVPSPPQIPLEGSGAALVRTFDQAERGGGQQCFSIAQDRAGRTLVATVGGLNEYDGERWRLHELPSTMLAVAVDHYGRIWVGGSGEVGEMERLPTGELRYRSLLDLIPEDHRDFSDVWPVFPAGDDVFFLAREYLFRLRGGEITSWQGDTEKIFYRGYEIHGRLFFAQLGVGLLELVDGDRLVKVGEGLFGGPTEINAFFELAAETEGGPKSGLLFTRERGAWRFDGASFEPVSSPLAEWLRTANVQHGSDLGGGRYAIATIRAGVVIFDSHLTLLRHLSTKTGLSENKVHFVTAGQGGHLWAGTDTAVDRVLSGSSLALYGEETGLAGRIYALAKHQGRLVVGTSTSVFQGMMDRGRFLASEIPGISEAGWSFVSVGDTLLAATSAGVFAIRFRGTPDMEILTAAQLTEEGSTFLFHSPEQPDRVFVSHSNGLRMLQLREGRWDWAGGKLDLRGEVRSAVRGQAGEWLVGIPSHRRVAVLTVPENLDEAPWFALHDAPSGFLMGLGEKVYFQSDGGPQVYLGLEAARSKWPFEPTQDLAPIVDAVGQQLFYVYHREENGRLWVDTEKGLRLLEPRSDSTSRSGATAYIDRPVGARPIDNVENLLVDAVDPAADPGADAGGPPGAWLAVSSGLFRFHGEVESRPRLPVDTFLSRAQVTNREGQTRFLEGLTGSRATLSPPEAGARNSTKNLRPMLPWAENRVRFEFASAFHSQQEEMLYQTRLDGLDADWSEWGTEASKEYARLPEGSYTFRARARSLWGDIGKEARFPFAIEPPWYRAPWALVAYFLAAIGAVLAVVRLRTASFERERRTLEEEVEGRTRELAEEKIQVERQALDLEAVNRRLEEENEHRRQLEGERSKLESRLEQSRKLESLGLMAGGIAHDFNNILMAILGNADLALENDELPGWARERLGDIRTGSERAADLCQQMLAYAGKGRFEEKALDLSVVTSEALGLIGPKRPDDVAIESKLAEHMSAVYGDSSQLRQVIANLLWNALEAVESGGKIVVTTGERELEREFFQTTVLAEAGLAGRHVFVRVEDDGVGMDADTRRRIFDPFFTTKFTGRGLGLAAALGIVRGHHGTLRVESELGEGTAVEIYLPALDEPLVAPDEVDSGEVRRWQRVGSVLIVDDEDIVRRVVGLMLRNTGFRVVEASGGEEAIELFIERRGNLQAVILDLTMPGLNGFETFQRLREIDPSVPVILSSGYGADELAERYLESGFAGFVRKPYKASTLRATLKSILEENGEGTSDLGTAELEQIDPGPQAPGEPGRE